MTKEERFRRVYFELTVFGKWKLSGVRQYSSCITLEKPAGKLWGVKGWIDTPHSILEITPKLTYKINGVLSLYDGEILSGFKRILE